MKIHTETQIELDMDELRVIFNDKKGKSPATDPPKRKTGRKPGPKKKSAEVPSTEEIADDISDETMEKVREKIFGDK